MKKQITNPGIKRSISATPETLRQHLETRTIEARPLWKPLHLQSLFQDAPRYGGAVRADLFAPGGVCPAVRYLVHETHCLEEFSKR